MIQGKWFAPGEDISEILSVREEVFGTPSPETDPDGWNVLVYSDGQPAATGRIWWHEGAFWLAYVGVIPSLRRQRLGDLVLRLLLFKAQSHAAREIRLYCPEEIKGFFARLGFRPISQEAWMVEMLLPGDEISLDSCANCKKQDCAKHKE